MKRFLKFCLLLACYGFAVALLDIRVAWWRMVMGIAFILLGHDLYTELKRKTKEL